MKHSIPLVFLFCLLASPLSAIDTEVTAYSDLFLNIEPSETFEITQNRYFVHSELAGYHDNSGLEWHLSANFYFQLFKQENWINPMDILEEAYLFLPVGNFDISLGMKYLTLGHADVYSSLNCAGGARKVQYSLDDPFLNRQSDPMLHIQYYPTFEDSFEIAYIPLSRTDTDRGETIVINDSENNLIVQLPYSSYLSDSLHNIYFAYNRFMEAMDLQFVYAWYVENTPNFQLSDLQDVGGVTTGTIEAEYNRKQTIGLAMSTYIGNMVLSQELALNITDNWNTDKAGHQYSDISSNTQIQTTLPGNILSQFMLIYQYMINRENQIYPNQRIQEEIEGFHQQPVTHIAFMIGHFEKNFFREKMSTSLNLGFFFSPNIYIAPRIAYNMSDHWRLETGADITLGDPSALLLKRNPINDNCYLRLKYQY